eukprot:6909515-Prymnesium_polylepis.1
MSHTRTYTRQKTALTSPGQGCAPPVLRVTVMSLRRRFVISPRRYGGCLITGRHHPTAVMLSIRSNE